MEAVVHRMMQRLILVGRLRIRYPSGVVRTYEGAPGPEAGLEIRTAQALRHLLTNPSLAFGEAFMEGALVPVGCSLYDVLDLFMSNMEKGGPPPMAGLRMWLGRVLRPLHQFNPVGRARRNVAHHYDLNGQTYDLMLDRDRQYSCAYFPRGDETLDEAQAAKKRHVAAKLLLDRPGLEVLDIGCGWGGLAITLARDYGARVTGITLSTEQLAAAEARAAQAGLADRVRFELLDYRKVSREYDRVVSVGMFEHVGVGHYRQFFRAVRRALKPRGLALVHAIGRSHGPGSTNQWLTKYIFPGGYSPALSEVWPAIERSGLFATDLEVLRLHYAQTLRLWRRNLTERWDAFASLYDERFCRMMEMYLAGCELAFRRQGHMVWQVQLAREVDAVPLTRDYISESERWDRRSGPAFQAEAADAD